MHTVMHQSVSHLNHGETDALQLLHARRLIDAWPC